MKQDIIREFRCYGYAVQHMVQSKSKCLLLCNYGNREYADIMLEGVEGFENEELLWYNKILFLEAAPSGDNRKKCYRIYYQGNRNITTVYAEKIELYQSTFFIREASRYAVEEWNKQHICLPSLMTAILMLETDNGKNCLAGIRELVREHTDYLASWSADGMQEENWKSLWGEKNYVLAVQHLQNENKPYFADNSFDDLLIKTIEDNRLMRFDI